MLVRLDLKLFKYNKANGRNNNTVTMVTGIFDRDGNYVEGIKKMLELHFKDETLAVRLAHGAVIKTISILRRALTWCERWCATRKASSCRRRMPRW